MTWVGEIAEVSSRAEGIVMGITVSDRAATWRKYRHV
jgi:hypothetical protein